MAAAIVLLCGCSRRESSAYMVSLEPQRWLLEQLVDSTASVATMLPGGADPETTEPSVTQRLAADDAIAYFATGLLPFEGRLAQSLKGGYVETLDGVSLIYGTHDHGDSHAAHVPDPHVWTSPRRMAAMAGGMAEALSRLTPEHSIDYERRRDALVARLDSIDRLTAEAINASGVKSFAVWHPFLSYFADDYGLTQIVVGQDGKEMSALQIKEAIDKARAAGVKVLFVERGDDSRQAAVIADGIGARLVSLNPMAYDFEQQMSLITDELTRP